MSAQLADSHEYCRALARRAAKNFYYSFCGLPPDQFRAMCALYAYMRISDDLGDDESMAPADRLRALDNWEREVRASILPDATLPGDAVASDRDHWHSGQPDADRTHVAERTRAADGAVRETDATFLAGLQVIPAITDVVRRFQIPPQYLLDVIIGVRLDVAGARDRAACKERPDNPLRCRFETFGELQNYCYLVAGVVGRCCIHIWGFTDPRALDLAIDCGLAFQLTNILRDMAEDADVGRVYLPSEDFRQFGYSLDDLRNRRRNDAFTRLMQFECSRTQDIYIKARELRGFLAPEGRPILAAMMKLYGGLLIEIRHRRYDVYSERVSLPIWRKLVIAAQAAVQQQLTRMVK